MTAAPFLTRNSHSGRSLQEAAQCRGVLQWGGGAEDHCSETPHTSTQVAPHHHLDRQQRAELRARVFVIALPSVAVGSADVGADADQEVHHAVVPSTDGVVEGGDALVVRLAGITHLTRRGQQRNSSHVIKLHIDKDQDDTHTHTHLLHSPLHCLQFPHQGPVQQEDKGAQPGSATGALTLTTGASQNRMVTLATATASNLRYNTSGDGEEE